MATGLIQQVQINNEQDLYNIASTVYGVCNTAANQQEKVVNINGFELITGTTIYVKFINNNASPSPTLKVGNAEAKSIVLADREPAGTNDATTGWFHNSILMLTYDGTNWVRGMGYNTDTDTDTTYSTLTSEDIEIGTNTDGKLISAKTLKDTIDDALESIDLSNINSGFTVADRTWTLGDTITRANLLSDLELSNALHFIGKVASNSTYTPSDGSNEVPTITGISNYSPSAGDVVIDAQDSREYVYTSTDEWELLGQDASEVYTVSLNAYERITSISQASDRTITVNKDTISILPILYGGTGTNSFNADEVILSTNPSSGQDMTLTSRAYKDVITANAILTSNNFVTERYIYYGLPFINNSHSYTSDTEIYAPVSSGQINHILISSGTNSAPVWSDVTTLESSFSTTANADAYDTLILGNNNVLDSTNAHSQGRIRLYSSGSTYTNILSQVSTTSSTFYLPAYNGDMYAVHTSSNNAVGKNTQPVYVAANGQVQALTYTPNRIYYSADAESGQTVSTSFEATNHYATDTILAINDADTVYTGLRPDYNLYVNGTTYFKGNVVHNGITYFANPTAVDITNGTAYYINNSAEGYLSDLRVDKVRLDDDLVGFYQNNNAGGTRYGIIQVSNATHMYLHLNDSTAANIFDFNGTLMPTTNNSYDIGTNFYRWKNLYLQGNLIMQDMGASLGSGNKITWTGGGDNAEIYYKVSNDGGRLVVNTNDTSCLIALDYNDTDQAYINTYIPSFYPETTNTGSLGLSTKRWSAIYVGTADDYGDPYQPIYWNSGVPDLAYPIQYFTWTIFSGTYGVTLTGSNIFKDNTYNVTLVITSGESNLNAPLTWTSASNPDTFTISSDQIVSGNVSGYAIVARGVDITSSLTSTAVSSGGSSNSGNENNQGSGNEEPGNNEEPGGEEPGNNEEPGGEEPNNENEEP